MERDKKKIIILAAAALIIIFTSIIVYKSGKSMDNKFFGKVPEQTGKMQDGKEPGSMEESSNKLEGAQPENNDAGNNDAGNNDAKKDKKKDKFKDIKAKAVYLSGDSAGNKKTLNHIIELAKTTELNAVVIDIKEGGKANYKSDVPAVKQNNAYHELYDVEYVIKTLHENNIYIIGRLVCFKDNILAEKRADLAIKRPDGGLWREGKMFWANPYNEEVWRYNLDIAVEAAEKGFDEIQFDYVRFPAAKKAEVYYGKDMPPKADAICKFLAIAEKELNEGKGVRVSADIFGIVCESPADGESIGQVLETVGKDIDFISPMLYPSHYANASNGVMGNGAGQSINGVMFTAPDLEPYDVVYNTLVKAKGRISKIQGYKAKIRPYLQAFTASYIKDKKYYQRYGAEQVRQQIRAVYDAGFDEWILWDPANSYSKNYFEKKVTG